MTTHAPSLQPADGYWRLKSNMADLDFLLNCPSSYPGWRQRLLEKTELFREDLSCHLAWQEEDGYLQVVESQAPHFHDRVLRLHYEQSDLIREAEVLQRELASADAEALPVLCRQLALLVKKTHDHETRRDELVLSAFTIEPAAMD